MPLLNSMGIMRNMTMFAGSAPVTFNNYLDIISDAGGSGTSYSNFPLGKFTSVGGSYVVGEVPGSAYLNSDGVILKIDESGYILSQIGLQAPTSNGQYNIFPKGLVIDSTNNVYLVGSFTENGLLRKSFIAKFDSSLNLLWQRQFNFGSTYSAEFFDVRVDETNGVVYACGYQDNSFTSITPTIVKYNSSTGALVSQRKVSTAATKLKSTQITSDTTNYYIGSFVQNSTDGIVLTKFSYGTDTFQWSIKLGLSVINYLTATDNSGNTYIAAIDTYYVYLLKISSTGSIVWQKRTRVDPSSVGEQGDLGGLTVDSSGNVYLFVGVYVPTDNKTYTVLLQISSSGTIIWQNRIQGPAGSSIQGNPYNSTISWRGNKLWVSFGYTFPQTYTFSLPDNGTLTGTFANYTYLPSTLVSFTVTALTVSTLVNTSATISFTDAAGVAIITSGAATQTVIAI